MADHGHGHSTPAAPDDPTAHADSPVSVFMVFFLVLAGAIATIAVSFSHMGDKAIYIHMAISSVQVALVGYYWMHLKKSDSLTWLIAGSTFFFMLILFALPLGDYLTRHLGGL